MTTMRNRHDGSKLVTEHEKEEDESTVDELSDDDMEDINDNDNDEEDEDDDKPLSSYLLDKSLWGQHAIAIGIALAATCVGVLYNNPSLSSGGKFFTPTPSSSSSSSGGSVVYAPSLAAEYQRKLLEERHHVKSFRRTANISFCEQQQQQQEEEDDLKSFEFLIPAELGYIMKDYYAADTRRDDWYDQIHSDITDEEEELLLEDESYACLQQQLDDNDKPYLTGRAFGYREPQMASLYRPPHHLSSDHSLQESKLSYTGFAAKFINLSPETVHLYWNGPAGKNKFVAEIQPYEAAGTATTPGQSFHIAPTYDKSHALKRYTLTANDALVVYDPYEDLKLEEKQEQLQSLTPEQKWKYDAHQLNSAFAKYYLIHTGRLWMSQFPRPAPAHHMWQAQYFDQKHRVYSAHTHFISLPKKEEMTTMTLAQMEDLEQEKKERYLKQYRSKELRLEMNVVSCAPRVFEIPNFLSPVEVQHLLDIGSNSTMEDSTVFPGGEGKGGVTRKKTDPKIKKQRDTTTRSSTNTWIDRSTSPILDAIHRRASDVLKIDESFLRHHSTHDDLHYSTSHSIAEKVQLVRYKETEEYKPHHDFTYPKVASRYQPVRFATLIFYLTTTTSSDPKKEGGRTTFPRALNGEFHDGIGVVPEAGKAVLFYNVLPDGNVDDWSVHGGEKVLGEGGEKWIANLWVWDPVVD